MAMLKNKQLTFSLILVCFIVLFPMAMAQITLPGPPRINILLINGRVTCTLNATLNGSAPAFRNAMVQLQCGPANVVVASTTTNVNGIFTFFPNQIPVSLATLVSSCRVFVATPLTSCNATLPPVNLASPLRVASSISPVFFNIILLVPTGFVPSVPIPSVPSPPTPSVPLPPTPSVPLPPTPSVPIPSVPLPPTPSVPIPSVPLPPTPSVPIPSVPLPPTPSVPIPSVPLPPTPSVPFPPISIN